MEHAELVRAGWNAIDAEPSVIIDRCFGVSALDDNERPAEWPTVHAVHDNAHRGGKLLRLSGRDSHYCGKQLKTDKCPHTNEMYSKRKPRAPQ
jgi:hypothetical protein